MIRSLASVACRQLRVRSVCPMVSRTHVGSIRCTARAFSVAGEMEPIVQTRVEHKLSGPTTATGTQTKFAVIQLSGKQYKCVEDDLLICDRQELDIGSEVVINDVLLVGTPTETIVGRPNVSRASVRAVCEQHPKDKKTIVFKKKRRKGYRRKNGFRRQLTALRVLEINDGTDV